MQNLNSKILYWIFLAVIILESINIFWFHVIFSPMLAVLFFVALSFSWAPILVFAISYGAVLDITSSVPFGQYIISFLAFCATILIFRKIFNLKNNITILIIGILFSLVFYILSLYVWDVGFYIFFRGLVPNLKIILQKNIINLILNFILAVMFYFVHREINKN